MSLSRKPASRPRDSFKKKVLTVDQFSHILHLSLRENVGMPDESPPLGEHHFGRGRRGKATLPKCALWLAKATRVAFLFTLDGTMTRIRFSRMLVAFLLVYFREYVLTRSKFIW